MTSSPLRSVGPSGKDPVRGIFTLPNQITISRLFLSLVFFILVALFDQIYGPFRVPFPPIPTGGLIILDISIGVFILAAATDWVDGHLARKWKMVSTFGRIADPFVDKVFICGSFIFLIEISPLVQPWFVVVIVVREFLVSGLRSFLESRGVPFGAGWGGKLKMGFQSITIPFVILYRANFPDSRPLRYLVIALLAATLLLTVTSTVEYVDRAIRLLRSNPEPASGEGAAGPGEGPPGA
jgi:CDP-diacylglycerol---glycerol-3-phosphate 3-phosphatidyltransferase